MEKLLENKYFKFIYSKHNKELNRILVLSDYFTIILQRNWLKIVFGIKNPVSHTNYIFIRVRINQKL